VEVRIGREARRRGVTEQIARDMECTQPTRI
jgi:hypothetical protein